MHINIRDTDVNVTLWSLIGILGPMKLFLRPLAQILYSGRSVWCFVDFSTLVDDSFSHIMFYYAHPHIISPQYLKKWFRNCFNLFIREIDLFLCKYCLLCKARSCSAIIVCVLLDWSFSERKKEERNGSVVIIYISNHYGGAGNSHKIVHPLGQFTACGGLMYSLSHFPPIKLKISKLSHYWLGLLLYFFLETS